MHTQTHTDTHTHAYMHAYTHIHTRTHTHTQTRTHTHIHTHNTRAHTHRCGPPRKLLPMSMLQKRSTMEWAVPEAMLMELINNAHKSAQEAGIHPVRPSLEGSLASSAVKGPAAGVCVCVCTCARVCMCVFVLCGDLFVYLCVLCGDFVLLQWLVRSNHNDQTLSVLFHNFLVW